MTDDRAGSGSRPYVVEVLEQLHPSAHVVTAKVTEAEHRFLVLPSTHHPRLLLPAGHRLAAARAAHRQVSGRGRRTRLLRAGAVISAVTGLADALAPAVSVLPQEGGGASARDALAMMLGHADFLVSMPISPRRANRKPVLQVTDLRGAPLAFVKVGHDELTRKLVRREAEALAAVQRSAPARLEVPRVLGLQDWGHLTLLALSPVRPRRSRMGAREEARALERTVHAISRCGDRRVLELASSQHVLDLRRDLSACGDTGEALLAVVDAVAGRLERVAVGGWHGDLNPGNLALRRRSAAVWDWERFERAVPLGFDLLHHRMTSRLAAGRPHAEAASELVAEAGGRLARLHPARERAEDVCRLYLCTIAARYLLDRQEEAGSSAGTVADWVLPAVRGVPPEPRQPRTHHPRQDGPAR